jgi:hypothetical protein
MELMHSRTSRSPLLTMSSNILLFDGWKTVVIQSCQALAYSGEILSQSVSLRNSLYFSQNAS